MDRIAWEDAVVDILKVFAAAIAGTAEHPFTSEQVACNVQVLEALARSAKGRRIVEIAELG